MIAVKGTNGVCIAADLVSALCLSEGKYVGKVWNVETLGYKARVASETGDQACAALRAVLRKEGIGREATITFQIDG